MTWAVHRLRRVMLACLLGAGGLGAADRPGLSVVLEARAAAARGSMLLLTRQRADGSWAGDPLSTAQVLIALANAPGLATDPQAAAAVGRAAAFLEPGLLAACSDPEGRAGAWSTEALAAALTALVRQDPRARQELLARGRAQVLARARREALADGGQGMAYPQRPGGPADLNASCAAVDAILLTEGLAPPWGLPDRAGLAAYLGAALTEALRTGTRTASPPPAGGGPGPAVATGASGTVARLARALLALGLHPGQPPLAAALDRLAHASPATPGDAFATAEALSLAGTGPSGWRDRLAEAVLGAQQGDGGWPGVVPEDPRDHSTALGLRALQVALGRYLGEAAGPE